MFIFMKGAENCFMKDVHKYVEQFEFYLKQSNRINRSSDLEQVQVFFGNSNVTNL